MSIRKAVNVVAFASQIYWLESSHGRAGYLLGNLWITVLSYGKQRLNWRSEFLLASDYILLISSGEQCVKYDGPSKFNVRPDTLYVSIFGTVDAGACTTEPTRFP